MLNLKDQGHHQRKESKERRKEGRKEGKKEGRKEGRKGGREGGREEGRKEGRKGGREEGREGGREGMGRTDNRSYCFICHQPFLQISTLHSLIIISVVKKIRNKLYEGSLNYYLARSAMDSF